MLVEELEHHWGRLRKRDIGFSLIYLSLIVNLVAQWDLYQCGHGINSVLMLIYIFHILRRIMLHIKH